MNEEEGEGMKVKNEKLNERRGCMNERQERESEGEKRINE